ncbi:MAG TPA: orotidine 5'-phosphate decarboxylase / HUMPS family protein [Microlunatus sp.]|nr:orotidine 5'-phosphate decarboxylase / HUMPS family protein [Microlunatus sp.]
MTLLGDVRRATITTPIVQLSLDLTNVEEALATAAVGVVCGIDWLEVGTPLLLAEGLDAVRELRRRFPNHPLVVDVKTMDGGYLEAEMMATAGADAVVVMARAHDATLARVCRAGADHGLLVMGDDLGEPDPVAAATRMEKLGVGAIIHHIGFDQRGEFPDTTPSPLDALPDLVTGTSLPVQAVGGLGVEQAIACPSLGAPLVVLGAPLAISPDAFSTADNLAAVLGDVVARIHAEAVVYPEGSRA